MHPDFVQALLSEWEKAQASWPTALLVSTSVGGSVSRPAATSVATLEDCQRWLRATRELLAQTTSASESASVTASEPMQTNPVPTSALLTPAQIEFVTTFQKRILIHAGDLKANPFECSLSECG